MSWEPARPPGPVRLSRLLLLHAAGEWVRRAGGKVAVGDQSRDGSLMMNGKACKGRGKKTSRAAGAICQRSGAMRRIPGPRINEGNRVQRIMGTLALSVLRHHAGRPAMTGRVALVRGRMIGEGEKTGRAFFSQEA